MPVSSHRDFAAEAKEERRGTGIPSDPRPHSNAADIAVLETEVAVLQSEVAELKALLAEESTLYCVGIETEQFGTVEIEADDDERVLYITQLSDGESVLIGYEDVEAFYEALTRLITE